MHKRSRKPLDINQLAAEIVGAATEDDTAAQPAQPEKNPAAVALGKLGGKKGGAARAAALTPEQRKKIAKKAAKARWETKAKKG